MNRRWILPLALFFAAAALVMRAHSQEDMTAVGTDVFERPQRPPAVFVHEAHNEAAGIEECSVCHHLYEDGQLVPDESSEDQRCADCHGLADDGRQPGLAKAFHRNCKGCHRERKQGPVTCGGCHRRGRPAGGGRLSGGGP